MQMKYNTQADVAKDRNRLDKMGIIAQTKQRDIEFDAQLQEQQIRMLQVDGTQEDLMAIQRGIANVQHQVQNKLERVLDQSQQVTEQMVEFEQDSEAAAERARQDADRMRTLKTQVRNRDEFEAKVEYLEGSKKDASQFQQGQFQQMKASDDDLKRVVEETKQAVHQTLQRRWSK